MAKLTNGEIELLAVQAIQAEATKLSNKMEANIAVRDTKVSFDGHIELFSERSRKTSDWRGFVEVQVKGTEVKKLSNGNISFSLGMDHFKNYYRNGGVVFFVVEVTPKEKTKIYYKTLLLLDLKKIIYLPQASKTITLTPLAGKTLRQVCEFYLEHKHLQAKSLIEQPLLLGSSEGEMIISSATYDPKKATGIRDMLDHEWYVYRKYGRTFLPMDSAIFNALLYEEEDWEISIGQNKYTFHVGTHVEEKMVTMIFDKTLKISINEETKKFNFHFLCFNSINHQIKTISLLLNLLEGDEMKIEEKKFVSIDITENSFSDISDIIEEIKENLRIVTDAQETMSILGADSTTIFSEEHEDITMIYNRLEGLNRVILKEEYHLLDMKGSQYILNFGIAKVSVTIAWVPWHTEKIVSAFSEVIADQLMQMGWEGQTPSLYSSYGLLSEKALAYACNIDYEMMKHSFDQIDLYSDETVTTLTNSFCLNCIKAYDLTKGKRPEVLELALYLYDQKLYNPENRDEDFQYINICQIHKRLNGELSVEQKRQLIQIKQHYSLAENPQFHFACNILMNNRDEAEYALEFMNEETLNEYKQYPIYKLYEQVQVAL